MTVFIIILIGFLAFYAGYVMADSKTNTVSVKKMPDETDEENLKLMEGYRNFLNYNGDEQ